VNPYAGISYWFDSLPAPVVARPPLAGDLDVDVGIIGGGYTGLWTAYYLAGADPSLRVAVLERDVAGFGASGRNGGWCSALFAASHARLRREHGADAAAAMASAMRGTVDEVGRVAGSEDIDCHYAKGGTVVLARSAAQLARLRAEVDEACSHGVAEGDLRLLSAGEAAEAVGATDVLGGTFTPHCAAVHPARLVRGLAERVEARGVRVFEGTPVVAVGRGGCTTPAGRVRAEVVVRATEGYTARIGGLRRRLAPVYSLMVSTEPLPEDVWQTIGLRRRETFADDRHLVIYGQRTADDRIAFGGRGAPYHYGSRTAARFDQDPETHDAVQATLVELFPVLAGVRITHRWGGPLGVPRDWFPSVGYDRAAGSAWAGGYVGDGVATSNLAGRTLADLITGRDTDLTALPWVGHRSPAWEPEPLRWLGINAALGAMSWADHVEARTGKPSRVAGAMSRLLGG
jgi:glycine/D-amino acid oxidase-like deaminating enzyme